MLDCQSFLLGGLRGEARARGGATRGVTMLRRESVAAGGRFGRPLAGGDAGKCERG